MPSTPQSVATAVLFDYYLTDAGVAIPNSRITVVLNLTKPATTISPLTNIALTQQFTTTDANGYWQFSLIPNGNIAPSNTTYTVQTPDSSYDVTLGSVGPYQSTALGTIVNVPSALQAPANTTISGTLTVGNLLVAPGETGIDTTGAGVLEIGGDNATTVELGKANVLVDANGNIAAGSLTVLASGPYVPNLPGASSVPTPSGIVAGTQWDFGGGEWNAANFGAGPVTDVHINAAIAAANAAGGGNVKVSPQTLATTAAINSTSATSRIRLVMPGVTIQPAANIDTFFIRQANGSPTARFGTDIIGVDIDGQSKAGVVGVRIRDNDLACIKGVHIRQCATGIITESVTVGRWAEINAIDDTFIIGCTTGMIYQTSGGANPSLGENHMRNVGISGCATGINIVSGATFYRCRLLGVTIWVPTNGTGLVVDSNMQDTILMIDFENNNGSSTNCTAVTVTTNASNLPSVEAHFGLTGTFNTPAITDAFTKGLTWKDGARTYMAAAYNGIGGVFNGWQVAGDTTDRIAMLGAFAGGGGFVFGDGTNNDTKIYRKQGKTLATDGAFSRSRQTPTETVLVSGVDATLGEIVSVTLTAARVVGAPTNASTGQNLTFEFTQGGVGAFAVTWNAVFKKTWADTGNATGKISTITFYYNGTNWVQTGAQAPYV